MFAIIDLFKRLDNFVLLSHENPDGDAVASVIALRLALMQLGKSAAPICTQSVPAVFRFLPTSQDFQKDFLVGDFEAMVVLDGGDLRHTGIPERIRTFKKTRRPLIVIDHHPRSDLTKLAYYKIVDVEAAATTQILYRLFLQMKVEISKDIATCLLTGLYTDTGGFKHSNTTGDIYRIASDLMLKGARISRIAKNISLNKSIKTLRLWGLALQRLTTNPRLGMVSSFITQKDLIDNGADETDIAGVVNLINSVPEARMAILYSETADGMVRASLRTESDKVDVSLFAKTYGGGGHRKASGFKVPGRIVRGAGGWRVVMR